jgi:cobalt-zinc-cadmium resistance protein CzcA
VIAVPAALLHVRERPLAVVVISGLVTSTLLTLVVVPALFKWFDEKPIEA